MKNEPTQPQLAPAMALVQLLTDCPELPPASTWSVDHDGVLTGHLHGSTAEDYARLYAYARMLGGEIRRAADFESLGTAYRSLRLCAVWRDVPVTLTLIVPVAVDDAVYREGQLAEQRHQTTDPFEPVLPGSGRTAVSV